MGFSILPILLVGLALYAAPAYAFGAGNIASISKIEGSNWRHGDLEDTLLQLFLAASASGGRKRKFTTMDVKRIYFGNWLRDYSQAIDTGSLKYVEANTVRILLWVLGFMTFGYATEEFEVTKDRLGCYRPEEHIDNPKDYNDNKDARKYDQRLRGPIDEAVELGIDDQTGLKNYIANERIGQIENGQQMATSAKLLRELFGKSIELGRRHARDGRKEDLFEAFRLMGTGLHCIEDYPAHSNYTELALIELGEQNIFPHVGANTRVNIHGRDVWPIVTGTFGGVDFLHSVLGEFSDKAIQSELSVLEDTISTAADSDSSSDQSIIKELMSKIGKGDDIEKQTNDLKKKSAEQKAATENSNTPWGLGESADDVAEQLKPFLEFHDKLMKSINEAFETLGLDTVIEKLAEAVSLFVFSLMAPFILPILKQVKEELKTGSSEVIASSEALQHIVFDDDNCSDPTHSMLAKDHFTNLLNEPAGKVAQAIVKFAVPLLMSAWDDESVDASHVIDQIIGGVFHHPAFRNGEDNRPGVEARQAMFAVMEEWWSNKPSHEQDEYRQNLSRDGVEAGKNHKEGQSDSGHGCGKPIHRTKPKNAGGEIGDIGQNIGNVVGGALENALSGGVKGGDGGLGRTLGGLLGGALAENFLGGGNKGRSSDNYQQQEQSSSRYESSSGYQQSSRQEYSSNRSGESQEYSSSRGNQAQGYYGGEEPQITSSYSTQESYTESTPSYTRTTERYGGSGRETEERTYDSRNQGRQVEERGYNEEQQGGRGGYGEQREDRGYGEEQQGGRGGYGEQREDRGYGEEQQGGRGGYGEQREDRGDYGGNREERQERQDYGGEEREGYEQQQQQRSYENRGGAPQYEEGTWRQSSTVSYSSHSQGADFGHKTTSKKKDMDNERRGSMRDRNESGSYGGHGDGGGDDGDYKKRDKKFKDDEKKKSKKDDSGDEKKKKDSSYGRNRSQERKKKDESPQRSYGRNRSQERKKDSSPERSYGRNRSQERKKDSSPDRSYGRKRSQERKKKEDSSDERSYGRKKKDDSDDEKKHRGGHRGW